MYRQLTKRLIILTAIFSAVFLLSGCSNSNDKASKIQPATSIQESVQSSTETKGSAINGQNSTNLEKQAPAINSASCEADYYRNVDGNCVHRPSNNPSGATAKCRDGSYSYSQHRQGTCSGHGGVAQWL